MMNRKLLKRMLVLAVSAAMVLGTCGTSLASTAADTAAVTQEADAASESAQTPEDNKAADAQDAASYAAQDAEEADTDGTSTADGETTVTTSPASEGEQPVTDEISTVSANAALSQDSDGYYLIGSADDMEAFAEMVLSDASINGRLTADITLDESFIPIGAQTLGSAPAVYFTGTFDGSKNGTDNYTVTLSFDSGSYLALFAGLGSSGTIQNLNIAGTVSGKSYCAGAVAYANGGTIQNVKSSASITSTSSYTGGILAYASGVVSVYACENTGTVSGTAAVGGIVGDLAVTGSTIAGCRNTGTVTGTTSSSLGAGGILGSAAASAYIYGCANTGAVSTSSSSDINIGGIAGMLCTGSSTTVSYDGMIQYCFNTGSLAVKSTSSDYAGGILGYYNARGLTIDQCYNSAEFNNNYGYYGGIAGYLYNNTTSVTNCYNTSDVGSSSIGYAGGITRYMQVTTTITNCYNVGTIMAASYAGAITANTNSSASFSYVTNCYYLKSSASKASGKGNTVSGAASVNADTLAGYASNLGNCFKEDSGSVNGGNPILSYQDLTVDEVRELMDDLDEASSSYASDLGYAYAAYYSLSDEDQELVFGSTEDILTVTKSVAETDTNGYALSSDLTSSISEKSYAFALYKADDENGTNAAAVAGVSYILTDASGNQTECVTGTDGSFTLKDGESATFGGEYEYSGTAIDMDTACFYSVTESDTAENFETSWERTASSSDEIDGTASGRSSGYVPAAGGSDYVDNILFDCTNTYVQDVVSVTKTVSDENVSVALYDELNADSYTFTLTKTADGTAAAAANLSYTVYEDDAAVSTGTTADDGSFTLTGGQTAKFIGVDLDSEVTYSVTESAPDGTWSSVWTAESSVSDASIAADGDSVTVTGAESGADTVGFTCTNTYIADTLTVTKAAAEKNAEGVTLSDAVIAWLNNRSYSFTLYESGTAAAGMSYDVYEGDTLVSAGNTTGSDGSFTIKGGQTASFSGLEMSGAVSYSVTEDDADDSLWSAGWTAVSSGSDETVTSDTFSSGTVSLTGDAGQADTIDFTCTNTYAADSVLLYTLNDLAAFSQTVADGYCPDAAVMADIDAAGTTGDGDSLAPVGGALGTSDASAYPVAYTGTFEGNDHTITLSMEQDSSAYYTALFAGLGEGGTIQNLTIAGTVSGGSCSSGLVAYATGGTIQNVTNNASVTSATGTSRAYGYAGGIVGCSTSQSLQITDCVNNGTVTSSKDYCGGILGEGYAVISGCTNNGAISLSSSYSDAGGIAGCLSGGSVSDSLNYGSVTGGYYLAGIAGSCSGSLQYCGNNGKIIAIGISSYYSGGVVGYLGGDAASVDSCYNKGSVSGTTKNGGVAGRVYQTSSVTNCYNTGSVTSSSAYVGGVVALMYYASELKNCYNTGALSSTASTTYAGGVVSQMSSTSTPANISNNYALDTADLAAAYNYSKITDDMMALVSSDTLKTYASSSTDEEGNETDSVLGSAYKEDPESVLINSGYPILLWEYHVYETSWSWSDDYSTATLIYACTDGDDASYIEAAVTYNVTKAATCTEEGEAVYMATAVYDGTTYTDEKTVTLDATGHSYEAAWTWAEDYSTATAVLTCTVCGDEQTVEATVTVESIKEATGTENGISVYTATAVCDGITYTDEKEVEIVLHTHVYGDPVWTWAEDYSTAAAAFTCTDCGDVQTVEATVTSTVVQEVSCTEDGETDYKAVVTFNETEYSDTKIVTYAATGHAYEAAWTWSSDYSTAEAVFTCANCGDTQTVTADVTSEVTTAATCETAGVRTYTAAASYNGTTLTDERTEEIEATGHSYGTPEFSWSEDYSTAEAVFTCSACGTTKTVTADVWSSITTAPTCTEPGVRTYTATAAYNGVSGTDEQTEEIEATGHSYVLTGWTWAEDLSSATATFTCENDTSHVDTVEAEVKSTKITAVSCTEDGKTNYTATVTYDGTKYTDKVSVTIAAGHSYEEVVTEPTCTEGGYTTYTCSVCGDTYTGDETEALGHDYAAVWTWAEDYSAASVTLTCSRGDDEQTYEASVSSETVEASADAEGSVTYTAVYTDADGNVYSDTVTVAVAYVPADDASDSTDDASDSTDDTSGPADDTSGSTGGTSGSTGGSSGSSGSGSVKNEATSSYTVPASAVSASKVSLTGATEAEVTATLQMLTDDGDLADSSYSLLQAKAAKVKKSSMKVTWKKVSGAVTYVVYANQCGKGRKLTKLKSTSSTSLNVKKIAGKKLKSGKYYKFLVVALDKNGQVIAVSKTIHAAAKGGKVTNVKSLSVCKGKKKVRSVSLKKGGSVKIKTKSTLQEKSKKLKNHRKVKYESSNTKIATVTGSGRIKAKAKGTCYIYAYAQNGVCSRIKVTVK